MPKRDIIVVGASAGGIDALIELIKHLPKDFGAAIFVTMHIGAQSRLPEILNLCRKLPVRHAEQNAKYDHGCVYIAPPNHHLIIKDGRTVLSRGPRENGHRPAIDILFRTAAREHQNRVAGVVLSGGMDDGTAGLYTIKKRGGVAIVQDPSEALFPSMPASAMENINVDFCLPVSQIAKVLVELAQGSATTVTESPTGGKSLDEHTTVDHPTQEVPGDQIPLACPECNGPIYEVREGDLARFQCFVGHAFSPESLTEQHTTALERALWTAMRTLKERTVLHKKMIERRRNKAEEKLRNRLEESIETANKDLKLLREILDRI